MNNIKNIYISSESLSSIDYCSYLDHYIFSDPVSGINIFYPTTAYGGPLSAGLGTPPSTAGVTFNGVVSGGPLFDVCYQDFCYRRISYPPIKLYCITTVNFILSGINEADSRVIKVIYNFDDNSEPREVSQDSTGVSPKDVVVSRTYYPADRLSITYFPSISVIRSDCCINTYKFTLSAFRCSILDIYNDVVLHNSQQTAGFDVIMTLEKENTRQLFNNALNINDLEFALPSVSSLPYLVEPVPPTKNKPFPPPVDPRQPTLPVDQNPIVAPEPGYYYVEGEGIDLTPGYIRIVPSEDIEAAGTSGIAISGDGPPYLPGSGVDIRYT